MTEPTWTEHIDCHVHLFPRWRRKRLIEWHRRFLTENPADPEASLGLLIDDLVTRGVRACVNLLFPTRPGEASRLVRFNYQLARRWPWIVPVGGVHAEDEDPVGDVQDAFERWGSRGLKFHPLAQRFSPADPALQDCFEYVNHARGVVYVHLGYEEWFPGPILIDDVRALVSRYPDITFVIPHLAYPRVEQALTLAKESPNVWLDLTGLITTLLPTNEPGIRALQGDADRNRAGAILQSELPALLERVVYGSDYPAALRSLERLLEDLSLFGITMPQQRAILNDSADRLLSRLGQVRARSRGH